MARTIPNRDPDAGDPADVDEPRRAPTDRAPRPGDGLEAEVGFVVLPDWIQDLEISDGALRLYLVLARFSDRAGTSWPSRRRLAERMGRSVDTVDIRVAELRKLGLLTVAHRVDDEGEQTSNLWTLTIHDPDESIRRGGRKSSAPPRRKSSALIRINKESIRAANPRPPTDHREPGQTPPADRLLDVAPLDVAAEAIAAARAKLAPPPTGGEP